MRAGDKAFPTIGGERPPVERWPAALFIGLERQPIPSYVYDDYTARYDDPLRSFVYDTAAGWPYERLDLFCHYHGLTITSGSSSGELEAGHVEMTLDNRDGSLSQYDTAGRLVDWPPGSALDIWAKVAGDGAYLTPAVGTVSTVDTADQAITGRVRLTWRSAFTAVAAGFPGIVYKQGAAGVPEREYMVLAYAPATLVQWSTVDAAGAQVSASVTTTAMLGDHTYGVEWTPGSTAATVIVDDVRTAVTLPTAPKLLDTSAPVVIGDPGLSGPLYWAQLERLDVAGRPAGIVWRFDANEYPGGGTTYTDPRGRRWTLSAAGAITATDTYWLFSGEVTAWRELADGTVEVEAFDAFSRLSDEKPAWNPGSYAQTPAARINALLNQNGYTGRRRLDAGLVTLHSYQTTRSPLEEAKAVASSDGGVLFTDADGTVVYNDRTWPTGRDDQRKPFPTFTDNVCEGALLTWDAAITSDDEVIVNTAALQNVANVAVTATNTDSVNRYGPQSIARQGDQWITAAEGQALADHLVTVGGDSYLRLEAFTLYVHDPRQDYWRVAIDRRIGDLVMFVHDQPTTTGVTLMTLALVVRQIVHDITPDAWVTTIGTTRTVGNVVALRYDRTSFTYDQADPRVVYAL